MVSTPHFGLASSSRSVATGSARLPILPLLWIAGVSFCAGAALDIFYFPRELQFPDERRLLASAFGVVERGIFSAGGDRAWEMPGAALFFSIFVLPFKTPEAAILPIRLAQAWLLALQVFLVGMLAWRLFGSGRAALIAALMAAIYPSLLFYQGLLLTETLFTTLLLAGLAALYWWRDRGYGLDRALIICGVCLTAAVMTKATLTFLVPFIVGALPLAERKPAIAVRAFVVSSTIYVALMAPWWVRNYVLFETFVPFSTSASANLYLGNNPKNPHAGIDWSADVDQEVVARVAAIQDEIARSRAFSGLAWGYIRAEPAAFLERAGRKFLRFWNIVPNAKEYRSWFYWTVSAASFAPVLVLAVLCAFGWRRQAALFAPIYLLIGYFTLLHVVTIASLRYRLPIEPLLIVMAAGPISASAARRSQTGARLAGHSQ